VAYASSLDTDFLARLEDPSGSGTTERIVPGYGRWDQEYPIHIQRYEEAAAQMPPGAVVLDAGRGTRYGTDIMRSAGASRFVGVDIAADAVQFARTYFPNESNIFLRDDCQTLEQASKYGPYDVICCLKNLEQ
jgi:2-polyprenyl-3-methyl-5-hydroxy-6-metoxy-1,4-benzoquinol methylase